MENGTYHYKIEAAVPLGVRRGSMAVELHNGALSGAINLLERREKTVKWPAGSPEV